MAINHNSLDTIHYLLHLVHVGTTLYNLEVDTYTNYKHTNSKITNSYNFWNKSSTLYTC